MKLTTQLNPQHHSRRFLLKAGATALFSFAIPPANNALTDQPLSTANGGTDPYPIPWLDKNGSHNQPAGPNLEPSHIYHFKGRVARCSTFTGMGTDNRGNRIAFGAPTTDYGLMQGEYLGSPSSTEGDVHPHMTDPVPGTGGPCKPDPRPPPSHCALRPLLGRCRARVRLNNQSGWQHLYSRNAERPSR